MFSNGSRGGNTSKSVSLVIKKHGKKTTEQNMIEQNILQQTDTKFHYSNGTVTFSKCNSLVGNKCNTIAHNGVSITGVRGVVTLRKQSEETVCLDESRV